MSLADVEDIRAGDPHTLLTDDGEYTGEAIVVASGGRPRRLDVPGSEEFEDRGVFDCATCDGPLYAGETVAVVGSTDWALTSAMQLSEYASRVFVVEEGAQVEAGEHVRTRVEQESDIEVRRNTAVREVDGDDVLQRIKLQDADSGVEEWEAVGGLYVQRGTVPVVNFLEATVATSDAGAIAVDETLETDVPGIFAAGDVRQGSSKTVAGAIGDGATAFGSALRYLDGDR